MISLSARVLKSPNLILSLAIAVTALVFASLPETFFPLLCLDRTNVAQGELWRLVTGNFVHFGWAHCLMNLSAFAIFCIVFASALSIPRFVGIVLFCTLAVGMGVYALSPQYEVYAGLSGAIHGYFIAGLLLNKRHSGWMNGLLIAALFAKVLAEHQPNYQNNQLQALLPVPVAYDAHLYGALAGLLFGSACLIADYICRRRPNH